jgi:hypothetical protein
MPEQWTLGMLLREESEERYTTVPCGGSCLIAQSGNCFRVRLQGDVNASHFVRLPPDMSMLTVTRPYTCLRNRPFPCRRTADHSRNDTKREDVVFMNVLAKRQLVETAGS